MPAGFLASGGFLIVATDSFSRLSGDGGPPRQVWTVFALVCVAPLTLLRRLEMLRFTSMLSIAVLLLICTLVVLFSLGLSSPTLDPCHQAGATSASAHACRGPLHAFTRPADTLRAFATCVVAFTCQQNAFAITNELRDPTPRRCLLVIVLAIGLALALYLIVGFAGYLTYGAHVRSDILETYPPNGLVDAARVGIAIVVITCYPLQAFAARTSLGTLFSALSRRFGRARSAPAMERAEVADEPRLSADHGPRLSSDHGPRLSSDHGPTLPPAAHSGLSACLTLEPDVLLTTALFLGGTAVLALSVSELGVVVDLNGSLAGTAITFIVPGAVFHLLHPQQRRMALGWGAVAMVAFGMLLVPTSLTAAFLPSPDPTSNATGAS